MIKEYNVMRGNFEVHVSVCDCTAIARSTGDSERQNALYLCEFHEDSPETFKAVIFGGYTICESDTPEEIEELLSNAGADNVVSTYEDDLKTIRI